MDRSQKLSLGFSAFVAVFAVAAPALAQNYPTAPYRTAGAGLGFAYLCCLGIVGLVGLALWILDIWMLIDAANRQEHEFPGSSGSSKTLWVVLLAVGIVIWFFGDVVGLVYYFTVYRKVKRGTMGPPPGPTAYATAPPAPPAPPGSAPVPPPPPMPEPPIPPMPPVPPAPPVAPTEPGEPEGEHTPEEPPASETEPPEAPSGEDDTPAE